MKNKAAKIAGAILIPVVTAWIGSWLTGITPVDAVKWVWEFIKACWGFSLGVTPIPRFLLAFFIFCSSVFLALVFDKIRKAASSPSQLDYREDVFEGVIWRWHYSSGGSISNTWCFCPSCDTVLVYREDRDYGFGMYSGGKNITELTCERCGEKKATLDGHRDSIVSRIERQIDRKLRVGEWHAEVTKRNEKQTRA